MTIADPKRARDHARAQGNQQVEAMPTLPPNKAASLPAGVNADDMIWEETIAAGGYATKRLGRGAHISLTDLYGDACVSVLLFNAEQASERLNVADTVKVQWNAYLKQGRLLLSDMGRVMASFLSDDAETHDTFCGASNRVVNAVKYDLSAGDVPTFPNARDLLIRGAAKHGLARKDVHPCVNLFKGIRINEDGGTELTHGPFQAGRQLVLRCEMDLIVVFANCPHVLDPREAYTVTPVRISAWRGKPAEEDDAIRNSAPEAMRAFLNTEDYYRR